MKKLIIILFSSITFYALCSGFTPAWGQVEPVIDFRTGGQKMPGSPQSFVEYRGLVYFRARDNNGLALYVSDGTTGNTYCLSHEIQPVSMVIYRDVIYMFGVQRGGACGLWRFDSDVRHMEKLYDFGIKAFQSFDLYVRGDRLILAGMGGLAWWNEDDNSFVVLVKMLEHSPWGLINQNIYEITMTENSFYFLGNQGGLKLLYSSYTEGTITEIADMDGFMSEYIGGGFFQQDGNLYYWKFKYEIASSRNKLEVFHANKDKAESELIFQQDSIDPIGMYWKMYFEGSKYYFPVTSYQNDQKGVSIYKVDGDVPVLFGFIPSSGFELEDIIAEEDYVLAFMYNRNDNKSLLYKLTGNETILMGEVFLGHDIDYYSVSRYGNDFLLSGQGQLYHVSGQDLSLSGFTSNVQNWFTTDTGVFLSRYEEEDNQELWFLPAGGHDPHLVKEINTDYRFGQPRMLTPIDNTLLYICRTDSSGEGLWKTESDQGNEKQLIDLSTGEGLYPQAFIIRDGKLFFSTPWNSLGLESFNPALWVTDGTIVGTHKIKELLFQRDDQFYTDQKACVKNGFVFTASENDTVDWELWFSDGTEDNTRLLKDIYPGNGKGEHSSPKYFTRSGDRVFFTALCAQHTRDLWMTDGTEAGTQCIRNVVHGLFKQGNIRNIMAGAKGSVVFLNEVQIAPGEATKYELWSTDGSSEGTYLLDSLYPNRSVDYFKFKLFFHDNIYFSLNTEQEGNQLWLINSNTGDIRRLTGFNEGVSGKDRIFGKMLVFNNKVFFASYDNINGSELWVTDGSRDGTKIFFELSHGYNSTLPKNLVVAGNRLLFFVDGDGIEDPLWMTDGSYEGTEPLPWNYARLVNFKEALIWKDDLYFIASHPEFGKGIFKYNLGGLCWSRAQGIGEQGFGFELYPNPAGDYINIRINSVDCFAGYVEIIDSHGKIVKEIRNMRDQGQIFIKDLPRGVYFMRVGSAAKKFVIN